MNSKVHLRTVGHTVASHYNELEIIVNVVDDHIGTRCNWKSRAYCSIPKQSYNVLYSIMNII